jgi:hypothetical protein
MLPCNANRQATRTLAYPITRCLTTPQGLTRWQIPQTTPLPVFPATRKMTTEA